MFMDKMKEKIDKGVATVTIKSNAAIESNKLRAYMKTLSQQIEEKQARTGKLLYQMNKDNNINMELLQEMCGEIGKLEEKYKESQKAIEQLKIEEQEMLGKTVSEHKCVCGVVLKNNEAFCGECGRKVD